MPDQFGALEFPAPAPATAEDSVTDPGLDKLASFLAAVLNAELTQAWSAVNPNKHFVEQFFTSDCRDSTFNERDLPSLFVWRMQSVDDQLTDDWVETTTDFSVLWVPQNAAQAQRSLRDPGLNGFQKTISRALYVGRDPAWVDIADNDPDAPSLGSVLITRAGFCRFPKVSACRREPVVIAKGDNQATYGAFLLTIKTGELTLWDPAAHGSPSALDATSTTGALTLETVAPVPPPPPPPLP